MYPLWGAMGEVDMISLPLVGALSLAWWIPQNLQHECSHAIVAQHFGAAITKIWPFPGMVDGRWYWAYVQYVPVVRFTPWQDAMVSAAPVIANTIMLVLYTLHFSFAVWPGSLVINSLFTAWALNNFIDGAFNLSTFYRPEPKMSTDGWKFWAATDINRWVLLVFTVLWQISFGSLIIKVMFF